MNKYSGNPRIGNWKHQFHSVGLPFTLSAFIATVRAVLVMLVLLSLMAGTPRFCFSAETDVGPLLKSISVAWETRQRRATSIAVSWIETVVRPRESFRKVGPRRYGESGIPDTDIIYKTNRAINVSDDKVRLETSGQAIVNGEVTDRKEVTVFDGETWRTLVDPNADLKHSHALIRPSEAGSAIYSLHNWPIMANFRFSSERVSVTAAEVLEATDQVQSIRGRRCFLLRSGSKEYWVDDTPSFNILRFTEKDVYEVEVFYEPHDDFGFVPMSWKIIAKEKENDFALIRADVVDLKLNAPISPDTFQLPFPPNTYVVDFTQTPKHIYIQRPDDTKRTVTIEERIASATYDELTSTESGQARPLTARKVWHWWTLLLTIVVVLVLLFLVLRNWWARVSVGSTSH